MKVGIPKGLLYSKYHVFMETFFLEIGAEIITSPETNRQLLNDGVKYCVDEACLPVKVFHGHVASLRGKCDAILIPRIMGEKEKEFICPKFCGLTEMISNSIPSLPNLIGEPIYWNNTNKLYHWAYKAGSLVTKDHRVLKNALDVATSKQNMIHDGTNQDEYRFKVALLGHPYNRNDTFLNMNLVQKLNKLGVGIITEETIDEKSINDEVSKLFKRPFWAFARNSYGAAVNLFKQKRLDGIIYISSFACGIDSVVIELIKEETEDLPFLILKIDEHTGEAGFDTRIEAFADMLGRRKGFVNHNTTYGKHLSRSQGFV